MGGPGAYGSRGWWRGRAGRTTVSASVLLGALLALLPSAATADDPTGPGPDEPAIAGHRATPARVGALPRFVYAAHRGGSLEERENSLSGLQGALDSGTVQVLEMDARRLADGTVVLMHDRTVDRTTNGTGPVSRFTLPQWRDLRLDLGSWLSPAPPAEAPPTLSQVLDRFGGKVVISLEAKDPRAVPAIARELRARGLVDSVLVDTNSPHLARQIDRLGLRAELWRSARQMRHDTPRSFARYVDVLDVDVNAADDDVRRFVRAGALRVWAHTVTTRAQRNRLFALGVTGVVTDDPRYVTGASRRYPAPPTLLRVRSAPAPAQVSDRSLARVTAFLAAGPALPRVLVRAEAAGIRAPSVPTRAPGTATVVLRAGGTTPGQHRVTLSVPAGHDSERRWTAASAVTSLQVLPEDLQLLPQVSVSGHRVRVRVRLLDSAATAYGGPGHETGPARTVAGLDRARVTVVLRRHGTVAAQATVPGRDTGTAGDGDGMVGTGFSVRPGRYGVTVQESGPTYAAPAWAGTLRVR